MLLFSSRLQANLPANLNISLLFMAMAWITHFHTRTPSVISHRSMSRNFDSSEMVQEKREAPADDVVAQSNGLASAPTKKSKQDDRSSETPKPFSKRDNKNT